MIESLIGCRTANVLIFFFFYFHTNLNDGNSKNNFNSQNEQEAWLNIYYRVRAEYLYMY